MIKLKKIALELLIVGFISALLLFPLYYYLPESLSTLKVVRTIIFIEHYNILWILCGLCVAKIVYDDSKNKSILCLLDFTLIVFTLATLIFAGEHIYFTLEYKGFNPYIIYKDFFSEYKLILISSLPFIGYCLLQLRHNKDKKFFVVELFTILFALSTISYPYYNNKVNTIYSGIKNLKNERYSSSSQNIGEKEEIIKVLNKYRYDDADQQYFYWRISNSSSNSSFNFSGINLVGKQARGNYLYIPVKHLYESNFSNSHLSDITFHYKTLSKSSFENSRLSCVDFSHSELEMTNFNKITIVGGSCPNTITRGQHTSSLNFDNANISQMSFLGVKIGYQSNLSDLSSDRIKDFLSFNNVKNITYSCFDKGVKEKIIKIFNLKVDDKENRRYEKDVCSKKRRAFKA